MTFLAPLGLVALLAIPAVVVLWLIYSRYRSKRVPSLLLWIDVPAPVAATRHWRLPRLDLLMLLQVLAVALLGLAIGRPAIAFPAARHVALVLDGSVSMQTQDVNPSRFDAARQSLLDVLDSAGTTDRFTVVLGSAAPRALARDVPAGDARVALQSAQVDSAAGDLVTALSIAAEPTVTEIVFATDGANVGFELPASSAPITFRLVGGQPDQVALSDVAVRQPIDGGQQLPGFATVANYARVERSTRVEVIADSVVVDSQAVTLAPGTRSDVTFSVPLNTRSVRVLLPDTDSLGADKRVDLQAPATFARALLVVSDHPEVWQHALASASWLTVTSVSTSNYTPPGQDQITLFDGWLPPDLPDTERIIVDPPGYLASDGSGPRTTLITDQDTADPLVHGVDVSGLTVTRDGRVSAPPWASLTLGSPADFVLGHGLLNGRRTVLFGFEPSASNLPELAAFPVLMANAIDWLTPGRGELVHAGLGQAVDVTPHSMASVAPRANVVPQPSWFEIWPYLVAAATLTIVLEGFVAFRRGLPRHALALSAAAMIAGGIALLQPGVWVTDRAQTLILAIDQSASITSGAQAQLDAWLTDAQRLRSVADRIGVVVFGRHAGVVEAPGTAEIVKETQTPIDGSATDLGQALRTAGALARGEAGPSRIVLLSDGQATTGDLGSAEESIAGTPVDVVPLDAPPPAPRVVLQSLDIPNYVRAGDSFSATLTVGAGQSSNVSLQTLVDGRPIKDQQIALAQGENRLDIDISLETPGFHRLAVVNGLASIEGFVVVKPPERVMVVEERPGESNAVTSALRGSPGTFDVVAPSAVTNLAQLEPYDAVVLSNVSATSFTLDQQRTLQSFVQDRGRGLVALGGSTSFVLGDYDGSVLEQMLPVLSTIPPRRESARLALVLVIDISQSMDRTVDGVSGIEMAKQAAILSERSLRDDDQVGVLVFNHRFSWLQPIGVVSTIGRSNLEDRIAQLSASGGTEIFAALNEGATAMKATTADLRHIVLFTDGNSRDANYDTLTADLRQQHIGLSTVGLGPEADTKLLAKLAKDGQGRFYYSDRPSELPRILATEVAIAKRTSVVEGSIAPQLVTPSPILRGVAPDQIPVLNGYVSTTARPSAEVVLASDDQKPLLAQWRSGLGRAVAWTSDVGGPWTQAWPDWLANARVWQQAVAWAAGQPVQPDFLLSVSSSGTSADVTLDDVRNDTFVDLASPLATITDPGGAHTDVPLRQSAPGRYEASVVVGAPGTYAITVTEGQRSEANGFVVRADPEQASFGADQQTLRRIASDSGGRVVSSAADEFAQASAPRQRWQPLSQALVVAALALFLVGLVARRLTGYAAGVVSRVRRRSTTRRAPRRAVPGRR